MLYELKGTLILKGEEQSYSSGFRKKEAIIETTEEKQPQKIKIEFTKDRIQALDNVEVGDKVDVRFFINGNEYKDKYFVSLTGWTIVLDDSSGDEDVAF